MSAPFWVFFWFCFAPVVWGIQGLVIARQGIRSRRAHQDHRAFVMLSEAHRYAAQVRSRG